MDIRSLLRSLILLFWINVTISHPFTPSVTLPKQPSVFPRADMTFVTPNQWHFRVVDVITAFGPDNVAFWGLQYFFHQMERAFLARSQNQQSTREFRLTMGHLELSVLSTVNNMPITWDKLIWFSRLLWQMTSQNSWTGTEFDAFIWDELTGETVWVALRVLLDAPLRGIGD